MATVIVFSVITDQILHMLKVYPEWGPCRNALNALALSYRNIFGILGRYIAARFASRNPLRHAWIVGFIGLALIAAGAATIQMNVGSSWYPITLAITALLCAWARWRPRSDAGIERAPSVAALTRSR